jgi:hypothetical protein
MISKGDNSRNAQIRADKEGYIFLSQDIVGNKNLDDVKFRLPTLTGEFVGSIELANSKYVKSLYDLIIKNKDNTGYIVNFAV